MSTRTCVGCKQATGADQLWRAVLARGGQLAIQQGRRKLDGRGAYVHPQEKCLIAALQRGGFDRSFRRKVIAPKIETLLEIIAKRASAAVLMSAQGH